MGNPTDNSPPVPSRSNPLKEKPKQELTYEIPATSKKADDPVYELAGEENKPGYRSLADMDEEKKIAQRKENLYAPLPDEPVYATLDEAQVGVKNASPQTQLRGGEAPTYDLASEAKHPETPKNKIQKQKEAAHLYELASEAKYPKTSEPETHKEIPEYVTLLNDNTKNDYIDISHYEEPKNVEKSKDKDGYLEIFPAGEAETSSTVKRAPPTNSGTPSAGNPLYEALNREKKQYQTLPSQHSAAYVPAPPPRLNTPSAQESVYEVPKEVSEQTPPPVPPRRPNEPLYEKPVPLQNNPVISEYDKVNKSKGKNNHRNDEDKQTSPPLPPRNLNAAAIQESLSSKKPSERERAEEALRVATETVNKFAARYPGPAETTQPQNPSISAPQTEASNAPVQDAGYAAQFFPAPMAADFRQFQDVEPAYTACHTAVSRAFNNDFSFNNDREREIYEAGRQSVYAKLSGAVWNAAGPGQPVPPENYKQNSHNQITGFNPGPPSAMFIPQAGYNPDQNQGQAPVCHIIIIGADGKVSSNSLLVPGMKSNLAPELEKSIRNIINTAQKALSNMPGMEGVVQALQKAQTALGGERPNTYYASHTQNQGRNSGRRG